MKKRKETKFRNEYRETMQALELIKNNYYKLDCAYQKEIHQLQQENQQLKEENEKYKNAWEELKEDCREVEKANDYILYERLQQLEQKYGIGE